MGSTSGDVGFVDGHPAANTGVEFVEVFDHQRAACIVAVGADAVERKHQGVAELAEVPAEPASCLVRQVGAGDEAMT